MTRYPRSPVSTNPADNCANCGSFWWNHDRTKCYACDTEHNLFILNGPSRAKAKKPRQKKVQKADTLYHEYRKAQHEDDRDDTAGGASDADGGADRTP